MVGGLHETGIFESRVPFKYMINESSDWFFPSHWHDAVEILYVMEGRQDVIVNGERYILYQRDILLIASGDIHTIPRQMEYGKVACIMFEKAMLSDLYDIQEQQIILSVLSDNTIKISLDTDNSVHNNIEKSVLSLLASYAYSHIAHRLFVKARLYDMLTILVCNFANSCTLLKNKGKQKVFLKKMDDVFGYINVHYDEDITLEDISDIAGYSPYYFSRIFKQCTGINFYEYLMNFRIMKAEYFMLQEDLPIIDIAFKVGFNSLVTFNRVFKKIKGCSPKEYIALLMSKMIC